jgi:hypothetical protein
MPTHFLELSGAATLATRHFQLTARIVDDLVDNAATGVVPGPAGLGPARTLRRHPKTGSTGPNHGHHPKHPVNACRLNGWTNLKKVRRHFSRVIDRTVDVITKPLKTVKHQI